MDEKQPRVGIPCDVNTLDDTRMHGVGEQYIGAVAHGARAIPYLLPALGAGDQMASLEAVVSAGALLDGLDGLFLTGSPSNVAPRFYDSSADGVGPFDLQRDRTTLALIQAALERDMPILAVCRGFQELNVACGGTLHTAVHELTRFDDHRADPRAAREANYTPVHDVHLTPGGLLQQRAGSDTVRVNSLHGQGIARLAESLCVEARAPDGLIEAVRRPDRRFVIGVQWHPEWRFSDNRLSTALFSAFGDALRQTD